MCEARRRATQSRMGLPVLHALATRRRENYRRRNLAWLNEARVPGDPGTSLLNHIQRTAQRHGVPEKVLLALILQETQFYHGRLFERWWTELFIVGARVRISALRNKSLGIASIKPSTAVRLLKAQSGHDGWTTEEALRLVARSHDVSIELAALELSRFCGFGVSDQVAFVAYGATQASAQALVQDPEATLDASLGLLQRSEHFTEHMRFLSAFGLS